MYFLQNSFRKSCPPLTGMSLCTNSMDVHCKCHTMSLRIISNTNLFFVLCNVLNIFLYWLRQPVIKYGKPESNPFQQQSHQTSKNNCVHKASIPLQINTWTLFGCLHFRKHFIANCHCFVNLVHIFTQRRRVRPVFLDLSHELAALTWYLLSYVSFHSDEARV